MWGASFSAGLDFQTLTILYFEAPIIADCFSSKVYFGTCFHLCMTKIGWHKKKNNHLIIVCCVVFIYFFLKGCKKKKKKWGIKSHLWFDWLILKCYFSLVCHACHRASALTCRVPVKKWERLQNLVRENQSWSVCGVYKGARQCGRRLVTASALLRFPPRGRHNLWSRLFNPFISLLFVSLNWIHIFKK